MLLTQAIMEVLKRHSSKEKTSDTKPLKQSEIVGYLKKEYPVEDNDYGITDKKVRTLLNKIIDSEISKADKDKSICYTIYEKKNGDEYKTDFWTPKSISDVELKYLIDAVMYSKIFDSATAQDLGRRIQDLSGKNLSRMTSYTSENVFGKQRLTITVDVLKNIQIIYDSTKDDKYIEFDFNVYDVVGDNIGLKFQKHHTVKPLQTILNDGRYFMLARYQNSTKVYTFSVDLMSNISIAKKVKDNINNSELGKNFVRAQYLLQHPYNMGGNPDFFKLRVKREYLSRAVDTFSYETKVIANSTNENTVDIRVKSSLEGMKRWLLFNYDIAEVIEPPDELRDALIEASNDLSEKIKKFI